MLEHLTPAEFAGCGTPYRAPSRKPSPSLCCSPFANPKNEAQVVAALEDLGKPLSVSHRILPEFREYERTSTVVVNAYLQPLMQSYMEKLADRVAGLARSPVRKPRKRRRR